jgi:hypothetical protein
MLEQALTPAPSQRARVRLLVHGVCEPANLATATCTRTLNASGGLLEIIRADGHFKEVSHEEMDRFVERFPIEAAC